MFGNRVATTTQSSFAKKGQLAALKGKLSSKKPAKVTGEAELSAKMGVKPMKAPPVVRIGKQGFKASRY